MAKKRFQAEQFIGKLREAEVEISRGQTIGQVVKKLGVTEQTYCRWRKEYGGLHSQRMQFETGWIVSASEHSTSSREALGRMDTSSPLMASCGTNFWSGNFLTRCWRPKS